MSLEPLELLAQLVVAIAVFLLCMTVFFNKLLFVLQKRESETILLVKEADRKMEKAKEMAKSYRGKIEMAHGKAQRAFRDKREEVIQREDQKYKDQESRISQQMGQEKKKVVKEVYSQREAVLGEAGKLAMALNKKFLRESEGR